MLSSASSVRSRNDCFSTRSRGGYPVRASSGKTTISPPASCPLRAKSRIFARLLSRSPTVLLIWAIATRMSLHSIGVAPIRLATAVPARPSNKAARNFRGIKRVTLEREGQMRSNFASLLLATAMLLLPVDVMAQRGQGGVATHGIHNGAYPSSVPVPRPIGPNIGGRPYPLRTDIPPPTGLIPPAAAYTGISPGAYRYQGNLGGHYGRGGGGALLAAPVYYPYLGYDSSLNTFPGYNEQIDPNAQAFAAAQESLGEQIRQLSAELDSVKRQFVTPPAPPVAPAVPQPPPAMVPYGGDPGAASQPPIVVVLKN